MSHAHTSIPSSSRAAESLLLALVIVAVQLIGSALFVPLMGESFFHPHAGIAVGWLLARGPRAWPGVLLGAALGDAIILFTNTPEATNDLAIFGLTAASQGAADLLVALSAYGLARWLLHWPIELVRPREILLCCTVVLPASVFLGTLWEYATLLSLGNVHDQPAAQLIANEFVTTLFGAFALTPFVLALRGTPHHVWQRRRALSMLVVVVYLGIVWGIDVLNISARQKTEADFRAQVASEVSKLDEDLASHTILAESVKAFYASSNSVERDEFASFCTPLLARVPGVEAIKWIPLLTHRDREAFEATARAEGMENFRITERSSAGDFVAAVERDHYFPVWFVAPLAGNQSELGFDLASGPFFRAAIDRARQTGRLAATGPIRLDQSGEVAVLLFVPIDSNNSGQFLGCGLIITNMNQVCARTCEVLAKANIQCSVSYENAPAAQGLLYTTARTAAQRVASQSQLEATSALEFGGHRWSVRATLSVVDLASAPPWILITERGSCMVLLGLLVAAQLYTSGRDVLVETEVSERSKELRASAQRFRHLFDAAPVALLAISQAGGIVMANREATELFGFSLDQLLGQSPNMLLAASSTSRVGVEFLQVHDGVALNRSVRLCQSMTGTRFTVQVLQLRTATEESQLTIVSCIVIPETRSAPQVGRDA